MTTTSAFRQACRKAATTIAPDICQPILVSEGFCTAVALFVPMDEYVAATYPSRFIFGALEANLGVLPGVSLQAFGVVSQTIARTEIGVDDSYSFQIEGIPLRVTATRVVNEPTGRMMVALEIMRVDAYEPKKQDDGEWGRSILAKAKIEAKARLEALTYQGPPISKLRLPKDPKAPTPEEIVAVMEDFRREIQSDIDSGSATVEDLQKMSDALQALMDSATIASHPGKGAKPVDPIQWTEIKPTMIYGNPAHFEDAKAILEATQDKKPTQIDLEEFIRDLEAQLKEGE